MKKWKAPFFRVIAFDKVKSVRYHRQATALRFNLTDAVTRRCFRTCLAALFLIPEAHLAEHPRPRSMSPIL